MKIAILQFNPQIGQVAANFSRAESLLMREEREGLLEGLDLLVLPELAFYGYNHVSLPAIAPYLEPTADGPSTRWASRTAKRLKCTVVVGYAENASIDEGNYNTAFDASIGAKNDTQAYNSMVMVNHQGDVVAHTRKSFLYYTDETWAKEGNGFYAGILPIGSAGRQVKATAGICMDINPYKFEAPWTAYEFANHARESRAKLVIISMAWLTRLSHEAVMNDIMQPDMNTVGYWIERLAPLIHPGGSEEEVIVVFANRTGEEGVAPLIGEVRYAGSSSVMGFRKGSLDLPNKIKIWNIFGRAQEGVLICNTDGPPRYGITRQPLEIPTTGSEDVDKSTVCSDTHPAAPVV